MIKSAEKTLDIPAEFPEITKSAGKYYGYQNLQEKP
jgi:hypothetical protein